MTLEEALDEIESLAHENQLLKGADEVNAQLRKALEYYSRQENWYSESMSNVTAQKALTASPTGYTESLEQALREIKNRLLPLIDALKSLEPSQPKEKSFKDVGEQIAELSRLMILHANAAKRFALIGKDCDEIAREALGGK